MSWVGSSNDVHVTGDAISISSSSSGDSPINALYKGSPITAGSTATFEFDIVTTKESPFIGVTNEAHFKDGYRLRGYLYHGNLADGSSLIKSNWGPHMKTGDKLAMCVKYDTKKLEILYELNGTPIGLAYSLNKFLDGPLYAVISGGDGLKLSVKRVSREITAPAKDYNPAEIVGSWKAVSMMREGKRILPDSLDDSQPMVTCSIANSKPPHDLVFKVVNTISYQISGSNGNWSVSPAVSTMMLPMGPMADLEKAVEAAVPHLKLMEMQDAGEKMKLAGDSFEFTFARHIKATPVTHVDL